MKNIDDKLRLKIDADLAIYICAMQMQQCGDTMQAILEILKPFLTAQSMNDIFKSSNVCYQLSRKLQEKETYRSDITGTLGVNTAKDKMWIYNQHRGKK